jgi:2-C-methyl-D-erythritol 4-phosphate cytidylyltransferase
VTASVGDGANGPAIWAVVPAAGHGSRFGGDIPKQYREAAGQPLIAHALDALLAHPRVVGAVVALAVQDPHWPGWTSRGGKPVLRCDGGGTRADSVLAALRAVPVEGRDPLVLVHDAARPNLRRDDIERLIAAAEAHADGAILAAPVHDTLKRADAGACIAATEPRTGLWRAMTPQAFHRDALIAALEHARADGVAVTDEAMAMEHAGAHPRLVEGRDDNLKVTTPADLALVDYLLRAR